MHKLFLLIIFCWTIAARPASAQDSTMWKLQGAWTVEQMTVKIFSHAGGQLLESKSLTDKAQMVARGRDVFTGIVFSGGRYEADKSGFAERGVFGWSSGELSFQEDSPPGITQSLAARRYKCRLEGEVLTLDLPPVIFRDPQTGQFVKGLYTCTYKHLD